MSAAPSLTLTAILSLTLAGLSAGARAADGASGSFRIVGLDFTVAYALAWRDGDDLKLTFSDAPFDRAAFAEDGTLDAFDFLRHDGVTIEVGVDAEDGSASGMSTRIGGSSSYSSGAGEQLVLARNDGERIAGHFSVADVTTIAFDLPVLGNAIARPGTALPADGGEPGQALLAQFAAIHAGDMDALIAMAPAEQAQELRAAVAEGEAEQVLTMARMFTPTQVRVTGGSQDGDRAWIDFTGSESGGTVTGTGVMRRSDGRWRVESTSTSQSAD
jgi:hypothetical protein